MFNKEGIPFFIIMIPFLSIIFIAFFSLSYYLKITEENFQKDMKEYKALYLKANPHKDFKTIKIEKKENIESLKSDYTKFIIILTICIIIFIVIFTFLMITIVNDIIEKYIKEVQYRENELENLNQNLAGKVQKGIQEAKRKDKAILQQAKLARMGSMISMIAHQWRQPLSELSGTLMELETATRFKKVDDKHILSSIEKSDTLIEFMSNTIDDFRNFYKPDKRKENFDLLEYCKKAIELIKASLQESDIKLILDIKNNKNFYGYPREFSQVILNLISNARDILIERDIKDPQILFKLESKGLNSIITVQDNAGGIPKDNLELIFDPYFSTKDSTKGTGLGLYISKLIIERNMGGELSVQNGKNGAIFKITLTGIN